MTMPGWIKWLPYWVLTACIAQDEYCGGYLNNDHGIIQTPNFPKAFIVPIRCRWVIDASSRPENSDTSIIVYFTQLYVATGLKFTEFDYYEPDSTFQLGGRVVHEVTEQNVTSVTRVVTMRQYVVVDFVLDRLEGNHLRVLDDLLDVYGFNITYETNLKEPVKSCSVVNCSLTGHCYASHDYKDYTCRCFAGFSGADCGNGPLCNSNNNICENGGSCRHLGSESVICQCLLNYTGSRCETIAQQTDCEEETTCASQCLGESLEEPCKCDSQRVPVSMDRARYEGTIRLTNVTAVRQCMDAINTCNLKPTLEKQIAKYLRSANLSMMEDLKIIYISLGAEVKFHFWGGKRDGSRVRESLNRLVQRGRLGTITLVPTHLAITQEPTLLIQSVQVNQGRPVVRPGEEFVLSCLAQGSSHMVFRWFKDGILINATKSLRSIWTELLPLDSSEQYTSLLGVRQANLLDQGQYTCQVSDWGFQQCKSVILDVADLPVIKVYPMSLTVEKGENITLKCISPNEIRRGNRFGYSWTKNNALFKMVPKLEYWEDLYPVGSILTVFNIQKSATYTCHVHGSTASVSRSVRVEVLNRSIVPWCTTDENGVSWDKAGPGVLAKMECPKHYSGVATRLCLLIDKGRALWQTPDFSDCVSDKLSSIDRNFKMVTLGYGNTTTTEIISGVLASLRDRGIVYPGEGENSIALLGSIVKYLNLTSGRHELLNTTTFFFSTVNTLLQHRNAIINHNKVVELQQVVNEWVMLWGSQAGQGSEHLVFDTLVVDLFRYETASIRNSIVLLLPRPTQSYPSWFTSRITIRMEGNTLLQNGTASIAVVTYNNLSQFLPQRYSQILENGSEVQYEVSSNIINVVMNGPVKVFTEIELEYGDRPGWELTCGVSLSSISHWDLTSCSSVKLNTNRTLCTCSQSGAYAALIVKERLMKQYSSKSGPPGIVFIGCLCCLAQSLLTLTLLLVRWWHHHNCILFLKLQCCTATAATMAVFLYATSHTVPANSFSYISTSLQGLILVGMSSHISKLLLVYTEIINIPKIEYLKQTIICIITGVPLLVVLCNHMAHNAVEFQFQSWWLTSGSMLFYTCISCGLLQLAFFTFLYFNVCHRLNILATAKNTNSQRIIVRRIGLLRRAAIIFKTTVLMALTSLLYVNAPNTKYQYMFSFTCALLGFVLVLCYILHCETPIRLQVLRTLNLDNGADQGYSSESDSSPLSFFTKQPAEAENDAAPSECNKGKVANSVDNMPDIQPRINEVPLDCQKSTTDITSEVSSTSPSKATPKTKVVRFHRDLVTGCDQGDYEKDNDLERYRSSKMLKSNDSNQMSIETQPFIDSTCSVSPTQENGSTRVCVITSVLVDSPSLVVCSVDVEPCTDKPQSVLSGLPLGLLDTTKSPGHPIGVLDEHQVHPHQLLDNTIERDQKTENKGLVQDGDVMDRICHDLDYLLNRVSQNGSEFPRKILQDGDDLSLSELIEKTSL